MGAPYEVGVRLVMTSNHAGILAGLSAALLGVHTGPLKTLTEGFGKLQLAIGGAVAAWAGDKILSNITTFIEKTRGYSDELTKLKNAGLSQGDIDREVQASIQATRIIKGITQEQALKVQRETYSILGVDEGLKVQDPLLRLVKSVGFSKGNYDTAADSVFDLLRSADIMGQLTNPVTKQVDTERLTQFLDVVQRINTATGGTVGPQTWLGMAKSGGLSLTGLDQQGLETMGMMAQVIGGPRSGTSMISLFQQLAGGTMFKRTAEGMEHLKLLKQDEWSVSGGRVVLTDDASKRLTAQFGADPLKWVNETILPSMTAAGITDPQDQQRQIYRILGRQTTQRFTGEMMRNYVQMLAERSRLEGGANAYTAGVNQDESSVTQNLQNLSAAYTNFWTAVAGPNSQNTITVLNALTESIRSMTEIARANPEAIKVVAGSLAAIGAGLLVLGSAAVVAAIAPLIGAGGLIAGLAAALLAFGALFHEKLIPLVDWIVGATNKMRAVFGLGPIGTAAATGLGANPQLDVIKGFDKQAQSTDKNTTATDANTQALFGLINFMGGGGGAGGSGLINAAYHPDSGVTPAAFHSAAGYSVTDQTVVSGPKGRVAVSTPPMGRLPGYTGGGGQWNYFQSHGMSPGGVPLAVIHTPYGSTRVAAAAADDYTGFFNDIHAAGAPIHSLSGPVVRHKRWGGGWSSHSYGAAIDLDNARYFSPEMKAWVAGHPTEWHNALSKYHMKWGHSIVPRDGSGPDDPHIEWGGPGSRAIPRRSEKETHIHTSINLDGRVISKNTLKHIAAHNHRPVSGPRLPDNWTSRPVT